MKMEIPERDNAEEDEEDEEENDEGEKDLELPRTRSSPTPTLWRPPAPPTRRRTTSGFSVWEHQVPQRG